MRQAYLVPEELLAQGIFIAGPIPEFELEQYQCFKLLKSLYGLCESGDE